MARQGLKQSHESYQWQEDMLLVDWLEQDPEAQVINYLVSASDTHDVPRSEYVRLA